MAPEKFSEKKMVEISENLVSTKTEGKGLSRRKFTRNMLVGSAVLLTLGNRSAWGADDNLCISTNLLASYENGQVSRLTDTTDLDNFIEVRDNYKIGNETSNPFYNQSSYRTSELGYSDGNTCFDYKPKD